MCVDCHVRGEAARKQNAAGFRRGFVVRPCGAGSPFYRLATLRVPVLAEARGAEAEAARTSLETTACAQSQDNLPRRRTTPDWSASFRMSSQQPGASGYGRVADWPEAQ